MIKLKAKENFTLNEKDFTKIEKSIERVDKNFNQFGRLLKDDMFEADEQLAKYLLNETPNPPNRAVVELVEVTPEAKVEEKEEAKKDKKKTNKKTIAKK